MSGPSERFSHYGAGDQHILRRCGDDGGRFFFPPFLNTAGQTGRTRAHYFKKKTKQNSDLWRVSPSPAGNQMVHQSTDEAGGVEFKIKVCVFDILR